MKILDLQQNTTEWLETRRKKIGASDAPIIMGVSPWKKPNELWEEKVRPSENVMSSAMERGHQLEPVARAKCEEYFCCHLRPVVGINETRDWAMASFDAVNLLKSIYIEIKCPGKVDHEVAQNGKIPVKYYPQLQHQMFVAEVDHMWYCSFDGSDCVYVKVERDEPYIKKMIAKEEEFYKCMMQRIPPIYVAQVESADWIETLTKLFQVKEELKQLQTLEKNLMDQVIQLAGGSDAEGMGYRLSKIERRGNVDYDTILKQFNIDANLEQFRKPSTYYYKVSVE